MIIKKEDVRIKQHANKLNKDRIVKNLKMKGNVTNAHERSLKETERERTKLQSKESGHGKKR